jgi:hypothetical protein
MREQLLVGLLAIMLPAGAQAQIASESPTSGVLPAQSFVLPSASAGAAQGPFLLGPAPTRPCCSRKGALIGLGVGAAAGIVLTTMLCESRDCASTYASTIVIFGGIGAGFGALADRPNRLWSIPVPRLPRVAVSPFVSRRASGALAAVRF